MDSNRFDALVRKLATDGTRRGLVRLLAALTVLGALSAPANRGSEAAGRRHRRKARHRPGREKDQRKGKRKGKAKPCRAQPLSTTCAGQCGPVRNNCRQQVDCGPCPCTDGSCGPCGTCGSDGRCTPPCDGGGCCDAESGCQPGTEVEACGAGGETCRVCSGDHPTCGDEGPGICGCIPFLCPATACGMIPDGCGETVDCGGCSSPNPVCDETINACTKCSADLSCPNGALCCDGTRCIDGGVCCDDDGCAPEGNRCIDGRCHCGGAAGSCPVNTPTCCGTPGACTNTAIDVNNCGACGRVCARTAVCRNGACDEER